MLSLKERFTNQTRVWNRCETGAIVFILSGFKEVTESHVKRPFWENAMDNRVNGDYSMESAHKWLLFTSCDTLKNLMSGCGEGVTSSVRHDEWINIVQAISMAWSFYFIHSETFSHFSSKIGSERLKIQRSPIRHTNESSLQWKSQYVWIKISLAALKNVLQGKLI